VAAARPSGRGDRRRLRLSALIPLGAGADGQALASACMHGPVHGRRARSLSRRRLGRRAARLGRRAAPDAAHACRA
jgi:hypothetical protein